MGGRSRVESASARIVPPFGMAEASSCCDSVDLFDRNGKPVDTEGPALALGDQMACVSLSGESFHGARTHRGAATLVPSRCAEGSGEMLVDAAARMLKELYPKNI